MPSTLPKLTLPGWTDGIRADADVHKVPLTALRRAENFLYRDGAFFLRPGYEMVGSRVNYELLGRSPRLWSPGGRPVGITQFDGIDDDRQIVLGTTTGWWALNRSTGVWTNLHAATPLTGGDTAQIVFRMYYKSGVAYLLGCNGADYLQAWDTDTDHAAVHETSHTMTPLSIMVLANRVIALANASDGPFSVRISNQDTFDTWSAFLKLLVDTPGPIIGGLEMGTLNGVIYKTDAISLIRAEEDPDAPFSFPGQLKGISGPASPLSIVGLPNGVHWYLSESGAVMQFDGASLQSLGRSIQALVIENWDSDYRRMAHGVYDPSQNEVTFYFAGAGVDDVDRSIVINVDTRAAWINRWNTLRPTCSLAGYLRTDTTLGDLATPLGSLFGALSAYNTEVPMMMMASSLVNTTGSDIGPGLFANYGYTDNLEPRPGWLETGLYDMGASDTAKTVLGVKYFFPRTPSAQTVTVELLATDHGDEPTVIETATVDMAAEGPHATHHRSTANEFGLRITASSSQHVQFNSVIVEAAPREI